MRWVYAFAIAVPCAAALAAGTAGRRIGTWADAGGHRLRLRIEGSGSPTVVFEAFGVAPAEAWRRVQPEVARFARTVSYDHAGFWGSEAGPRPRDGRRIAAELRQALRSAGVGPPYVLVGHSFGGPYSRIFAAMHPRETAGLVLVDPSQEEFFDWLRAAHPEFNRIPPEETARETELGCSYRTLNQAREAAMSPAMPVLLITATGLDEREPARLPLERRLKRRWLAAHERWARGRPRTRHLVTSSCGHAVPLEQPGVVVAAVREILRMGRDAGEERRAARDNVPAEAGRPRIAAPARSLPERGAPGDWR